MAEKGGVMRSTVGQIILAATACIGVFSACHQDERRPISETSDAKYDTMLASWKANASWVDSVVNRTTIAWQRTLHPGEVYAVDYVSLVDAHVDRDGTRSVYFRVMFPEADLVLSCPQSLARYIDSAETGASYSLVYRYDSLVLESVRVGDISLSVSDKSDESFYEAKLMTSRVLHGEMLDLIQR